MKSFCILWLSMLPVLALVWAGVHGLEPEPVGTPAPDTGQKQGLAQQERDLWWRRLHWDAAECPREAIGENISGVQRHALADGRALTEITCFLGAYQGQSLWYLESPGKAPAALAFDQFDAPDRGVLKHYRDPALLGVATVDAGKGRLKVLRKYRGIGDCGQLLTYRFADASAELVELRRRDCDDDAGYVPPDNWPLVPLEGLW